MVTGRVPFEGPNPSSVMHKHLKTELTPPDHVNPQLSSGVGEIIEVCMQKSRRKRYQSTADLLSDLAAVSRGEAPVLARKNFDLSQLAALEESATTQDVRSQETIDIPAEGATEPMYNQPLFWVAVSGWIAAVLLLVVAIVK